MTKLEELKAACDADAAAAETAWATNGWGADAADAWAAYAAAHAAVRAAYTDYYGELKKIQEENGHD